MSQDCTTTLQPGRQTETRLKKKNFFFNGVNGNVELFLSLEHLEAISGVIIGHNFNIVVSQGIGQPKESGKNGEWMVCGAVRRYTTFIKFTVLCGHGL